MTNATAVQDPDEKDEGVPTITVQKVAVVNGNRDVLQWLEPLLDGGRCAIMFVESTRRAYSDVRRLQPNLIILCLDMDDIAGFHVLSMLKLDSQTREIPVVTFTTDCGGRTPADEPVEPLDAEMFQSKPAAWMN
ncbi:MAG: hypothetical protein HY047_12695 [Acidobacteria bacterium]|nr:hypothetical protein [Acidobacteriota bacterium]